MKCLDYVQYVASVSPDDALFIASGTDNTPACIAAGLTDRSFLGLNIGLAISIGLGLAVALPHRRIFMLEGDGGFLHQISAIADLASRSPPNAIVIVNDNESYHGVYPTHTAATADIAALAKAAGIRNTYTVRDLEEFKAALKEASSKGETACIVAKTEKGRGVIPPNSEPLHPLESKFRFVRFVEKTEKIKIIEGITSSAKY